MVSLPSAATVRYPGLAVPPSACSSSSLGDRNATLGAPPSRTSQAPLHHPLALFQQPRERGPLPAVRGTECRGPARKTETSLQGSACPKTPCVAVVALGDMSETDGRRRKQGRSPEKEEEVKKKQKKKKQKKQKQKAPPQQGSQRSGIVLGWWGGTKLPPQRGEPRPAVPCWSGRL